MIESFVLDAVDEGRSLTWDGELGTDFWALGAWWGSRVARSCGITNRTSFVSRRPRTPVERQSACAVSTGEAAARSGEAEAVLVAAERKLRCVRVAPGLCPRDEPPAVAAVAAREERLAG